jgi:pimeloyl-ACP methyl ester carboxylesterase
MDAPRILQLPDGRALAYDDVGDPGGQPVVYLHGTPDSRLARHPDDGLAAAAGARLLALDRPGAGGSGLPPEGRGWSLADDVTMLLDALGVARVGLLGWSSGGLAALGVAASLGRRVAAVATVGTLPPVEAYADAAVVAALGSRRRPFVELATELLAEGVSPGEIAAEVAPHLVPDPVDEAVALDAVLEGAGEDGRRELDRVPGAAAQLARALVEATRGGVDGLAAQVTEQLAPGPDLRRVSAPVTLWHGITDEVGPPAVGAWLAERLPAATVEVVPGSHHLLLARWVDVLDGVVAAAQRRG